MSPFASLTVLTLAWALAASEPEQSTPTFSKPFIFNFDVQGGSYESQNQNVDCSTNMVRAEVQLTKYRWDKTWHPGVKIFLLRGSGANQRILSLAFSATHYHPPFRIRLGSALDDSKDLGTLFFNKTTGQTGQFSFQLEWNSAGDVIATVGDEQHTFNLGGRPESIRINVSGGQGSVTYELGHQSDKDSDSDCKVIS